MNWRDRIVADPEILLGKPTIRGTRISVEMILNRLSQGWDVETLLQAYPHVTGEDVRAALAFAAEFLGEERYIAAGKATA